MKEIIRALEDQVAQLKKLDERLECEAYENKEHKNFRVGDLVTDGKIVGFVGWIENKCCNCTESQGYMGVDIVNGDLGFIAPVKRDDWALCEDKFYTNGHQVKLCLTGIDIYRLRYDLRGRNVNPSPVKTMIFDLLDKIVQEAT